jgi:hypothetical protein
VYLERSETVDDPNLEISGLSPRDNARFRVAAEVGGDISGYFSYQGPALLLAVRGEKDGRVVTFDLTFALYDSASLTSPTLDVTADALVTSAATVAIEALFTDKVGSVHFGTFVDADVDHDGVITGAEMLAPGDCTTRCSSLDEHSLLETILSRVAGIFVSR